MLDQAAARLQERKGQPGDTDGGTADDETRDAFARAGEDVEELAAELEIVLGGKAGADGWTG